MYIFLVIFGCLFNLYYMLLFIANNLKLVSIVCIKRNICSIKVNVAFYLPSIWQFVNNCIFIHIESRCWYEQKYGVPVLYAITYIT